MTRGAAQQRGSATLLLIESVLLVATLLCGLVAPATHRPATATTSSADSVYTYDAAPDGSSPTAGRALVPGLGLLSNREHVANVLGNPARSTPDLVAAETAPDYVNIASPARTEHILNGDATGGGHMWPGAPGKTPFPEDWSGAEIMHEVSDIATDPASTRVTQGGREVVTGTRGGVDIRVIVDYNNNDIITTYPTNLPRN